MPSSCIDQVSVRAGIEEAQRLPRLLVRRRVPVDVLVVRLPPPFAPVRPPRDAISRCRRPPGALDVKPSTVLPPFRGVACSSKVLPGLKTFDSITVALTTLGSAQS